MRGFSRPGASRLTGCGSAELPATAEPLVPSELVPVAVRRPISAGGDRGAAGGLALG
jgi:hypothetical protein